MTKQRNRKVHPKIVRDSLLRAVETSDHMRATEQKLVEMLTDIDQKKFYVRFGYKSLMGFCYQALKLPKTQSQSIVTKVRRSEPTSNIGSDPPSQ